MKASDSAPVVLITGCSTGIGRALAKRFQQAGCTTWATARRPDAIDDLPASGIHTTALDVTDSVSISSAVRTVESTHGRIDILINNAGIPVMGPVAEVPLDDLRQLWETNLTGPVAMAQAVIPGMVERRSGHIVNVGSVSGILTTPFAGPYCASKGALHHLNDAMRMELKAFGIFVQLVQPGGIASNFGASAKSQTAREWKLFAAYKEGIERRAGASQERATPTDAFAQSLVAAVLASKPKPIVRIGAGSDLLPRLAKLPVRVKDRLLSRRFGLAD
ncbi:SDR family NAD(P)-dependent oxidoreductase [Algiphilus sp.]|uniref:SDR family NAD(P)-dependent oxidoreductase n=1 Tax=Algiphilus sp. TaxID=1872431 RepID=UPI001CA6522F|nr:SDR family NAD(P)-dependent oxidoreductase [Algiphilus sp.]MBY8964581.1 SDR family NAD(P)-dependent oxidoreductase [Algiphilus acroporae]MCI5062597.1 SDR family NAD(P)-dependent oxidoreductase [Algiphilus sp.]MCI5103744.1 SDR family NAD(P)-dependent oxidoreductase [Algiphilus sp.]MCR9090619.1 SDR family NAD(P)-dependent oxidoreductase [Pseudomonadota bacterium]